MARISGINLPDNKKIEVGLSYIYGIGPSLSKKIIKETKISAAKKVSELSAEEVSRIQDYIIKNFKVEGDLKRETMMNIKRLKEISCWRGIRHIKKLPTRGQTTRVNSRTVRGNVRKTVGSGRKPPPAPT